MLQKIIEQITSSNAILGIIGALITPFLAKAVKDVDYRNYMIIAVKNIFKALIGGQESAHRLFINAERNKRLAKKINFTNDRTKTDLFQILMITIIDVNIKLIKQWIIENKKLLRSSKDKVLLRNSLENLFYDIQTTYENEAKEKYFLYIQNRERSDYLFSISYEGKCLIDCPEYLSKGEPCGDICIKTIGFKKHYSNISILTINFIETIPENEGERNLQLFANFLNNIDSALYVSIYNAKKAFEMQNGRYKK